MNIKVKNEFFDVGYEDITSYCQWLKRKNSVVLFKIEQHIGMPLTSTPELLEIRNLILDVSNDIARLPSNIMIEGEVDEKL
jgi:hypothetical protein